MNKQYQYIGKSPIRIDARDKVTGAAHYIADLNFPNQLYGKMVLAGLPHAMINRIDTSQAEKLPGVVAVLTAKHIPGKNQVGVVIADQPLLAERKVRYSGDCVALIAAESKSLADQASRLIHIEYQELPGIFSPLEGIKPTAAKIHDSGNLLTHYRIRKGNIEKGFNEADIVVEQTLETGHQEHLYLETLGAIAVPQSNGEMTIYGSLQCPFYVQKAVATALGIGLNYVRVIQTVTGGGFGGKEDVPSEICARAAVLAQATNRPVKLILDREEDIITTSKRHPAILHYKYGAKKNGKLTAAEIEIYSDIGAYATLSTIVLYRMTVHAPGPYIIPNVNVDTYGIYTNHPPCGALRGFGTPQANFGSELTMDLLAEKLGIDPITLRLRNALTVGSRTATNQLLKESVGLKETLRKAKQAANWTKKTKQTARVKNILRNQDSIRPRKLYGIGCATMYYGVSLGAKGWSLDAAGAHLQLLADGTVSVAIGNTEMGQGAETVLAQITAESLGVSLDSVRVMPVDTSYVPDSGPTVASRTTVLSGNAIVNAANQLKQNLIPIAARLLATKKLNEIMFQNGYVFLKRNPQKKVPFSMVAQEAFRRNVCMFAIGWYHAPEVKWDTATGLGDAYYVYSYGTQIAEVEVDTLTGKVNVLTITAAHDVGKAINPTQIEQQVEGGVVQGIGYALYEKFLIQNGTILTDTCATYTIPTALDTPANIKTIIVESESKEGPFGAKGVGEPPIIPTAAAIANAVSNALGKRITRIPITPEAILDIKKQHE
ncbi:MAG: xanthine dehydrogenase family protein molybdopterin-binding subunit [bacterium]|nr:xanthine dehydrogenase family protein molybdopterin-binding subunit [bacterium]